MSKLKKKNCGVIIGAPFVGKSSIMMSKQCKYIPDVAATIGSDLYVIKSGKSSIQIIDTSGHNRFESSIQGFIDIAETIIFVFSHNDIKSCEKIVGGLRNNPYPTVKYKYLIGNKIDLKETFIKEHEIRSLIKNYELHYFATSAKKGINIEELFESIFDNINDAFNFDFDDIDENNILLSNDVMSYETSCFDMIKRCFY